LKTPVEVRQKVDKGSLLFLTLRFNDREKDKGKK
jgi:hypothetical protein